MTDGQKRKVDECRALGYGYRKIAGITGVSINSIKSYCRRQKMAPVNRCGNCGAQLAQIPGKKARRFCCDRCRNMWWRAHQDLINRKAYYGFICLNCGKSFEAYGARNRKYCSRECYIEARYGGKGND